MDNTGALAFEAACALPLLEEHIFVSCFVCQAISLLKHYPSKLCAHVRTHAHREGRASPPVLWAKKEKGKPVEIQAHKRHFPVTNNPTHRGHPLLYLCSRPLTFRGTSTSLLSCRWNRGRLQKRGHLAAFPPRPKSKLWPRPNTRRAAIQHKPYNFPMQNTVLPGPSTTGCFRYPVLFTFCNFVHYLQYTWYKTAAVQRPLGTPTLHFYRFDVGNGSLRTAFKWDQNWIPTPSIKNHCMIDWACLPRIMWTYCLTICSWDTLMLY